MNESLKKISTQQAWTPNSWQQKTALQQATYDDPAALTETLGRLEGEGRVAFRYVDNPNGSARNIAGVLNEKGNVLGMMPHPERSIAKALAGEDGTRFFKGVVEALG